MLSVLLLRLKFQKNWRCNRVFAFSSGELGARERERELGARERERERERESVARAVLRVVGETKTLLDVPVPLWKTQPLTV